MAKYRVIVDKGVEIGGQRYPHDAVIDSEKLTDGPKPPPAPKRNASEDEKAKHAEAVAGLDAKHEGAKVQAAADLEALLKRGATPDSGPPFLEPYVEKKEA